MELQDEICILCLEKHKNCKAIEEDTKNVLGILMPKIDFTIILGPVICRNCGEMLKRCLDFKTKCLYTHNSIIPFINKNGKVYLKDVYLTKSKNLIGIGVQEDICGFCMGLVENISAISLEAKEGNVMLEKMVKQSLPEVDLSVIEKPVICASCLGSLENCFHFMTNCLIADEKIKRYRETLDIDSKNEIDLTSVLEFTIKHVKSRVDGNSVGRIKVEREFCEDKKSLNKREIYDERDIIKQEEMFDHCENAKNDDEIKNESFAEVAGQIKVNNEQFTPKNTLDLKEEINKLDFIKIEGLLCEESDTKHIEQNLGEMEDQNCLLNEEIEIKTDDHDFDRFEESTVLSQPEVTIGLHRNQKCLTFDLRKDKMTPYIEEPPGNNNVSAIAMYKCNSCEYQTKYKMYLKRHLLKHKDPSKVTIYKCAFCLYETNRKDTLTKHLLKHKDPSEVTMYKCDSCLHQTKYKGALKNHLLRHNASSKVTIYKCDSCLFQTRFKGGLKIHLNYCYFKKIK